MELFWSGTVFSVLGVFLLLVADRKNSGKWATVGVLVLIAGLTMMATPRLLSASLPDNYVHESTHELVTTGGEYAHLLVDGRTAEKEVRFAYEGSDGVLHVLQEPFDTLAQLHKDADAVPSVEIFKNRNGTWYAIDENSLWYLVTVPKTVAGRVVFPEDG